MNTKYKILKILCHFRIVGDGTCLYDALSVSLIGDDSLSPIIRWLVYANLYLNSKFFANHSLIQEKYASNPDLFASKKSMFTICMNNNALGGFLAGQSCDLKECVRKKEILNRYLGTWSSMMCIIASANVLQRTIRSHYPCNKDKRIHTVLNTSIKPEVLTTSRVTPTIDILWTRSDQSSDHNYNHFVPLFIRQGNDHYL